jgi:hypothetical protein
VIFQRENTAGVTPISLVVHPTSLSQLFDICQVTNKGRMYAASPVA